MGRVCIFIRVVENTLWLFSRVLCGSGGCERRGRVGGESREWRVSWGFSFSLGHPFPSSLIDTQGSKYNNRHVWTWVNIRKCVRDSPPLSNAERIAVAESTLARRPHRSDALICVASLLEGEALAGVRIKRGGRYPPTGEEESEREDDKTHPWLSSLSVNTPEELLRYNARGVIFLGEGQD